MILTDLLDQVDAVLVTDAEGLLQHLDLAKEVNYGR